MKHTYYKVPVIAGLMFLFSVKAQAQYNFGVSTGNWSGTQSLLLNPALIADNRERFTIDLVAGNGGIENNLGSIKGGIIKAINNGDNADLINYTKNDKFSLLAPYGKINGPGCMISINHRHSLALTTAIRGMSQFNNFDRSLYQTITNPADLPAGDATYTSKNFNYTAHIWSEIGISYGAVVLDNEHNELRVGVTMRYLGGIGYIGLKGKNLNVQYKDGNDTVYAYNSDIQYASNILGTKTALFNGFGNNNLLSQFFGSKDGHGFGADLGIVYDYFVDAGRAPYEMDGHTDRIDYSTNRYKFRISASVLDLGAINYKSTNNSNLEATGNGYVTGTDLSNNLSNFTDFSNYLKRQGFSGDSTHHDTKVHMPTRLLLNADYNLANRWYLNAAYAVNLANRQNFGNSYYNQVTVTPRYDSRLLSIGLPITYGLLSKSVKMGLGFRISGFFVGSDDMLSLFANNQYGANFYVGGFIPFGKTRAGDRDHDGVSNRLDKCPDEFGPWENRGCPNKDEKGKELEDKTEN